jgi:hypothetical protein
MGHPDAFPIRSAIGHRDLGSSERSTRRADYFRLHGAGLRDGQGAGIEVQTM